MMCSCGRRIPSGVAYCPYCGQPNSMYHGSAPHIETPPIFTADIPEESSSKNVGCGGIVLGLLIVLVGLLLGLVAFLAYSGMSLEDLANHFGFTFMTTYMKGNIYYPFLFT